MRLPAQDKSSSESYLGGIQSLVHVRGLEPAQSRGASGEQWALMVGSECSGGTTAAELRDGTQGERCSKRSEVTAH